MRYCPQCNHVSQLAKFCYLDGTRLEEYQLCTRCQHPIGALDRYCEQCGAKTVRGKPGMER